MSANTTYQTLLDTADKLIFKLTSDGVEANVETVNAAALYGATYNLLSNGSYAGVGHSGFVPGEHVVGSSTGAEAVVVNWFPANNTLVIVNLANTSVPFNANDVVTGLMTGSFIGLNANTPQISPVRTLDIESLWFSISSGAKLILQWEGTDANSDSLYVNAALLFDSGYFGKNALATLFPCPAANASWTPTGSLAVTSLGLTGANVGYTLVVEARKGNGYSVVPDERFKDKS